MAIKGFEKKDPMAGLNQLMQMMNQMNQMQDRKARRHMGMEDELGKGLESIYNNTQLEARQNQFNSYYQNNKENMDEDTIARFDLLNQKISNQAQLNKDYQFGMEKIKNIGRQVEDSLVAYSDIQGMSVEDLNSTYLKLLPDSNQNINIEAKREELRQAAMGDVQTLVDSYTQDSSQFRASHGERLGRAGFRQDAAYIQNLNEMFAFGIVQAKDDYVFDSAEAEAMQMGIELGSYQPIEDYRRQELNRNRTLTVTQDKELKENYETIKRYQTIIDDANKFQRLVQSGTKVDRALAAQMANQVWYTDGNDEEVMYDSIVGENEFFNVLGNMDAEQAKYIQNVKNIDNSYNKREGISWLQDNNTDSRLKFKFEDIETSPPPPENKAKVKTEEAKVKTEEAPAIISKNDSEFFTEKGWTPVAGRSGKGWAAETTVKKEKLDEFMSLAFNPDNFENGKIKENSEIYQLIQRAKKGGSRRMKKVEQQLKRYAQGIKNYKNLEKEGFDPPAWANRLVDEVKFLLTTKKRRK